MLSIASPALYHDITTQHKPQIFFPPNNRRKKSKVKHAKFLLTQTDLDNGGVG